MTASAFDIRDFFHRFALHAAIIPRMSRARAVRMSALLYRNSRHLSLLGSTLAFATPKCRADWQSALGGEVDRRKDKRIRTSRLYKRAHNGECLRFEPFSHPVSSLEMTPLDKSWKFSSLKPSQFQSEQTFSCAGLNISLRKDLSSAAICTTRGMSFPDFLA